MHPPRIILRCFGGLPSIRLSPHPAGLAAMLAAAFFTLASGLARAEVLITVNKSTQRMTVDVDGVTRWNWPVSTGRPGYDTPNGHYTAFRMEADHYSKEWDDAPMPHSIFFTKVGHAIHGYLDTRHIGSPASHGCVRLDDANAAKLYQVVADEGVEKAKVVITGEVEAALSRGKSSKEAAAEDASDKAGAADTSKSRSRQVRRPRAKLNIVPAFIIRRIPLTMVTRSNTSPIPIVPPNPISMDSDEASICRYLSSDWSKFATSRFWPAFIAGQSRFRRSLICNFNPGKPAISTAAFDKSSRQFDVSADAEDGSRHER